MIHKLFEFLALLITPPYHLLTFGVILFCLGVEETCSGKAISRGQGWVYRAKEPKTFWFIVATSYLLGAWLIGLFFNQVQGLLY